MKTFNNPNQTLASLLKALVIIDAVILLVIVIFQVFNTPKDVSLSLLNVFTVIACILGVYLLARMYFQIQREDNTTKEIVKDKEEDKVKEEEDKVKTIQRLEHSVAFYLGIIADKNKELKRLNTQIASYETKEKVYEMQFNEMLKDMVEIEEITNNTLKIIADSLTYFTTSKYAYNNSFIGFIIGEYIAEALKTAKKEGKKVLLLANGKVNSTEAEEDLKEFLKKVQDPLKDSDTKDKSSTQDLQMVTSLEKEEGKKEDDVEDKRVDNN